MVVCIHQVRGFACEVNLEPIDVDFGDATVYRHSSLKQKQNHIMLAFHSSDYIRDLYVALTLWPYLDPLLRALDMFVADVFGV